MVSEFIDAALLDDCELVETVEAAPVEVAPVEDGGIEDGKIEDGEIEDGEIEVAGLLCGLVAVVIKDESPAVDGLTTPEVALCMTVCKELDVTIAEPFCDIKLCMVERLEATDEMGAVDEL